MIYLFLYLYTYLFIHLFIDFLQAIRYCQNVEISQDGSRMRSRKNPTYWPKYYLDNPSLHEVCSQPAWQPTNQVNNPLSSGLNPYAPVFVPRAAAAAAGKETAHSSNYVKLLSIYCKIISYFFFLYFH